MPKAPQLTSKEKRQLQAQAYAEGDIQAFPGAPIWNEWVKEKREAKKREVGMARRIGRTALGAAAGTVVIAKELPRAINAQRRRENVQKAARLQRVVNRTKKAEALPDGELHQTEKSRVRRIGRKVMDAIDRGNERALKRTNEKIARAPAPKKQKRQKQMGPIEAWANNRLDRIDEKRRTTHQRRQEEFDAEKQVAWGKYLAENPAVKAELIAKQIKRNKHFEINAQSGRYYDMQRSAKYTTTHFASHNAPTFSKALPRRPDFEGSYDELAKSSIALAAKNRREDGSISLFSQATFENIVLERLPLSPKNAERDGPVLFDGETRYTSQDFYTKNEQLRHEVQEGYDYTGGVATSLWKMGFVNFDNENSIPYGQGTINPDVEWSYGDDGTTFASIAYNPENELHRIVAGDQAEMTSSRIQLAINERQPYAPDMSVSLVQQPALLQPA